MTKTYTQRQQEKDANVINYIHKHEVNLMQPNHDIGYKIHFLKVGMKYKYLRVGSNSSGSAYIPVEDCTNGRITAAVRSQYNGAISRQKKYKAGKLEDAVEVIPMGQLELKFKQ